MSSRARAVLGANIDRNEWPGNGLRVGPSMPSSPLRDTPNPPFDANGRDSARPPTLKDQLLWICPIAALVAAAALLWLFGLRLWTALGVALLVACPLSIAWALLAERLGRPKSPRVAR